MTSEKPSWTKWMADAAPSTARARLAAGAGTARRTSPASAASPWALTRPIVSQVLRAGQTVGIDGGAVLERFSEGAGALHGEEALAPLQPAAAAHPWALSA